MMGSAGVVYRLSLLLLLVVLSACTRAGAPADQVGTSVPPIVAATSGPTGSAEASARPVDESLTPVSRSSPSPAAKSALTACGLQDSMASIIGFALIPKASDAVRYADFYGTEPELKYKGPAWLITLKTKMRVPSGYLIDPTCIVIDGQPSMLLTGGEETSDGTFKPPLQPLKSPDLLLPPLTP